MSPVEKDHLLKTFYQAMEDRPLEPDDKMHVDLSREELRGADPVASLETTIRWALQGSAQLMSGFRGTGKSTELRRLKRRLQDGEGDFVVLLCDMDDYVNMTTPLDVSDLLLTMAGAVGEGLAAVNKKLAGEGYYGRFLGFLQSLRIDPELRASLPLSPVELKLSLRHDPTLRERIQKQLSGHVAALVQDVRAWFAERLLALRAERGEGTQLVVLFDSMEKIRGTSINEAEVTASLETVFAGHAARIVIPEVHLVFTVPPWLKVKVPALRSLYQNFEMLPCVKVKTRDGAVHPAGVQALVELVEKRAAWRPVISDRELLERLILCSGGYLRDLLHLLQSVARLSAQQSLPVARPVVEAAISKIQNGYLPLTHEDARWLAAIHAHRSTELEGLDGLGLLARLFDNLLVLTYRNGAEWYDVHPLVQEQAIEMAGRKSAPAAAG
jgi:hypothetical protein